MAQLEQALQQSLQLLYGKGMEDATLLELYNALCGAAMQQVRPQWEKPTEGKTACYLSAEFLIGRMVYANLLNMGRLEEAKALFAQHGLDIAMFEEVEDAALGNGGLGRLAACFLDSGATEGLRLDGYGIRYQYGLFKQLFDKGFQIETADDWQRFGDPWSLRKEDDKVLVEFADSTVWAVPYDMPVIGYGMKTVNTLRLWQAEALESFDFALFNEQRYDESYKSRNDAESIHAVLYPNDDTDAGKRLRLKQQYFFSSASLQSILREFKADHGDDWDKLPECYAIQLNDTHPTVAIPEMLRILMTAEHLPYDEAFAVVQKTFAYTNHTLLAEALEKWDIHLFNSVVPQVYPYIVMLNDALRRDLVRHGIPKNEAGVYEILHGGQVHMARMAIYATHSTNGVAALHTQLLKTVALKEWEALYPGRINNKTNGITQRRWLALCNPELAGFITRRLGDGWLTDLAQLERLLPYAEDAASLEEFTKIKLLKKQQLAAYIEKAEGVNLPIDALYDVQVKRLHEYKRQLLNAFSILDIYFALKDGTLQDFAPMVFLFGAKAAPGYYRAKGIIKYINEIAKLVNNDADIKGKLCVEFVQNYNVSYAERLIPAADLSEQISTAGTEASGTGNMKLMLNGAATLGTFDGANIEIVERAGEENNYIFGARVEQLHEISATYDPMAIYKNNPRIRRVVDTLIDGTLDDGGSGMFQELYDSLLRGATWHAPDNYFLLLDFEDYVATKLRANRDWQDSHAFAAKALKNIAAAGFFSSDRTIREYATEIWGM